MFHQFNAVCLTAILGATVAVSAQTAQPAQAPAAQTPAATTTAASADVKAWSAAVADQKVPEGGVPIWIRPETPEQRKARIGTSEDPGIDPDPKKVFWRFGRAYHIDKTPRMWAVYDGEPGFVRPLGNLNFSKEIYQQNEKFVWAWYEEPTSAPAPEPVDPLQSTDSGRRFAESDVAFFRLIRPEYTLLAPPAADTVVRFEESSKGLPTTGSWRNSLAVADMNGDGKADLIAPPERGIDADPAIFLGDGKGNWTYWNTVKWPVGLAYGSVAAADFNKDGKMDLAFASHLQGVFVFLGDGKGNFTDSPTGLPRDFPTRRLLATDVDRDGLIDVVAISEGPTARATGNNEAYARVRVYYNRKNGTEWEGANVADVSHRLGGDYLTTGNFNGDKYPDFAAASIYFSSADTVFLSNGAKKWNRLDAGEGRVVPYASYYMANTAGTFSSAKTDDVILSFARFWPADLNPTAVPMPPVTQLSGLDRIAFEKDGPKRYPIIRWAGNSAVWGLASGDFNGDRKLDVIFTRSQPREVVLLLNDGKGNFTQAKLEGLVLQPQANYDVKVADVNGDNRPDVILMYETSGTTAFAERAGSIQVFLNRGTAKVTSAPAAKTATGK